MHRLIALSMAAILGSFAPGAARTATPGVRTSPPAILGAGRVPFLPAAAPAFGTYGWPVHGPVIRGYVEPPDPYSAGHRGIDIAAPFGSVLRAAQRGVVAFAGYVAGALYISIDHPDGVRTTYSWISAASVTKGQQVTKGQSIGRTGHGHPDVATPHLHFGARVGSTYLDPMLLLEGANVAGFIHLAPLTGQGSSPGASFGAAPTMAATWVAHAPTGAPRGGARVAISPGPFWVCWHSCFSAPRWPCHQSPPGPHRRPVGLRSRVGPPTSELPLTVRPARRCAP